MTDIVDELRARALQGRFNLEAADEIERLRAELSEQCRLLGMSGEREAKHLAQIAALEKERDALRAELDALRGQKDEALNTLCKVFHAGEEFEGQDGMIMAVDLALWNEGCEAIERLVGGEEDGASPYARPVPAQSVPTETIVDYLVSISAHVAHRDDAQAQKELGELLKMLAAAPEVE